MAAAVLVTAHTVLADAANDDGDGHPSSPPAMMGSVAVITPVKTPR